MRFVDSNVLLYSVSADPAEAGKAAAAVQLLGAEDLNAGQVFDGVTVVNPFSDPTDARRGAIQD